MGGAGVNSAWGQTCVSPTTTVPLVGRKVSGSRNREQNSGSWTLESARSGELVCTGNNLLQGRKVCVHVRTCTCMNISKALRLLHKDTNTNYIWSKSTVFYYPSVEREREREKERGREGGREEGREREREKDKERKLTDIGGRPNPLGTQNTNDVCTRTPQSTSAWNENTILWWKLMMNDNYIFSISNTFWF